MKTRVMGILLVAGLATGCSDGIFTTATTNPLVSPDYNYEIDTWGANSEVYEFTPKSDVTKTCVFVMLDNARAMSMQCFNKTL
jgi:hypothetical protein